MRGVLGWLALAVILLFPLRSVYPLVLFVALCILTYLIGLSQLIAGVPNRKYDALAVLGLFLVAGPAATHIIGLTIAYVSLLAGMLVLLFLSFLMGRQLKKSVVEAFNPQGYGARVSWVFALLVLFAVVLFVPITAAALQALVTGWVAVVLAIMTLLSYIDRLSGVQKKVVSLAGKLKDLFLNRRTFLLGIAGVLVAHYTFFMIASLRLEPTLPGLGLVVLSVLPAYIWYKVFKVREDHIHLPDWPGWLTSLVLASLAPLLLEFPVRFLPGPVLVPVIHSDSMMTLVAFLGIFGICLVLGMIDDYLRRALMMGPFLAAVVMMGIYVYHAFVGAFFRMMIVTFSLEGLIAAVIPALLALFLVQSLFYITGYLSFLYEMWRE